MGIFFCCPFNYFPGFNKLHKDLVLQWQQHDPAPFFSASYPIHPAIGLKGTIQILKEMKLPCKALNSVKYEPLCSCLQVLITFKTLFIHSYLLDMFSCSYANSCESSLRSLCVGVGDTPAFTES